jgi:acyl-CoA synthetase (AMP-forming)/AMP-acid ligase II
MIIRGGENIYPVEIENVLIEHEAVKEVAAIGVPHERLGEEVAVVVVGSDALTEEAVVAHCREHLAAFKVPSHVLIWSEPLPRNATNKLLKPAIREQVLARLDLAG